MARCAITRPGSLIRRDRIPRRGAILAAPRLRETARLPIRRRRVRAVSPAMEAARATAAGPVARRVVVGVVPVTVVVAVAEGRVTAAVVTAVGLVEAG